MQINSIHFKIVEPMMFKGSAEFSQDVMGPRAIAQSNILPYPSTIAGALATLVLEQDPGRIPNSGETSRWAEEISQIIGKEVKFRGPYLVYNNQIFVQKDAQSFVKVSSIMESASHENALKPKRITAFGIKIDDKTRNVFEPTTDRSMVYSSQMVTYGDDNVIRLQEEEKEEEEKEIDVSIGVDIINCSSVLNDAVSSERVIRFGGEGRLVKVCASSKPYLPDHQTGNNYLYSISPILFETGNNNELSSKKTEDNWVGSSSSTSPKIQEIERKISKNIKLVQGSMGLLGGFSSTSTRRRKPIYGCIMAGSKIETPSDEEASKLAMEGLGLFSNLGFGSVV